MPPQRELTINRGLSQFERCATEILERIVLFAVEDRFLGPPSDLLALLTTSKTINFALSPERNNSIYAEIFAFKFDTAAASRRLTRRWLTSKSLATELRHRFEALKRIRSGVIDGYSLGYDLWTVFIILLEHDHKNALQLTKWARTYIFANAVAVHWLGGHYGPGFGEDLGSLVCVILWELVREADLTEQWRRGIQELLYTHVVCGYRFSSFYAPEEFFKIEGQPEELGESAQNNPPPSTQAQFYGHTITIAAPPLASACLSVFMIGMEPNLLRYTPGYREEYIPGRTFSERMDDEWYRLIMCHDITATSNPPGGSCFTPSTLVGSWKGIVIVPNLVEFSNFLHSDERQKPFGVPLKQFDVEMNLREHHCLGNEIPLMAGSGVDQIGADPLHAWIPRGTTFNEDNGALEIDDPIESRSMVYQTYQADTGNLYAPGNVRKMRWAPADRVRPRDGLAQLVAEIINLEPEDPDETQGLVDNPSYIDNDYRSHDTVEHLEPGIRDIIITGTMKTGDHVHRVEGRIRYWDALIILRRLPLSAPNELEELNWVFRGYVHGERHFVGRWKQALTPVGEHGWEGGFMFRKDL